MDDKSGSKMEWTWLLDAYETERRDLIDERVAEVRNDRATWLFYAGMMSVGKQTAECCGAVAEEKDEEIQASKSEDETKGICEMADYEVAQHAEADCAARAEVLTELSVTWAERAWRKPLSRMAMSAMRRLERCKREKARALLKEWSSRMKAGRRAEKNKARRGTKKKNKQVRTLMAARDVATRPRMLADVMTRLKAGLIQRKAEDAAQKGAMRQGMCSEDLLGLDMLTMLNVIALLAVQHMLAVMEGLAMVAVGVICYLLDNLTPQGAWENLTLTRNCGETESGVKGSERGIQARESKKTRTSESTHEGTSSHLTNQEDSRETDAQNIQCSYGHTLFSQSHMTLGLNWKLMCPLAFVRPSMDLESRGSRLESKGG